MMNVNLLITLQYIHRNIKSCCTPETNVIYQLYHNKEMKREYMKKLFRKKNYFRHIDIKSCELNWKI